MKPKSISDNIKTLSNTYTYLSFRLSALKELVKDGGQTLFENFKKEHNRSFQILRYERIVDPNKLLFPIPTTSYVTPKTFAKHCKCLRKFCNVISLPALLDALRDGKSLADRTVVITIDGGHLDSFLNSPIPLTQNGLSATYFIATSYIGSDTLYPEDRMVYICERLKMLDQKINRSESTVQVFSAFKENDNLEYLEFNSQTVNDLLKQYRTLTPERGEILIRLLGESAKSVGPLAAPEPDFMNWNDLDYLQSLGFNIGSLGHSYLPHLTLTEDEISADYLKAKTLLEDAGINPLDIVGTPYDLLPDQTFEALSNMNKEFILYGQNPKLELEISPIVLGRKFIVEATSFSEDLFIKDIWS